MNVYKHPVINEIKSFYGDSLFRYRKKNVSVYKYLRRLSKKLWEGIKDHNPVVEHEIKNYHPAYIEGDGESFFKNSLKKKDARLTIAREFGFRKRKDIKSLDRLFFDQSFEKAVDCLLNGEIETLKELLKESPNLIHERSKFGHQATLLHYTASNGVELWRQIVPMNLPEITKYLLDQGADIHSKMYAYGSEFDTLALLGSSAHPFDAGIGDEMIKILTENQE